MNSFAKSLNPSGISSSELPRDRSGKYLITQESIKHGTLIIDQPGHYTVAEDLTFNPNPVGSTVTEADLYFGGDPNKSITLDAYLAGDPLISQYEPFGGAYDPAAYGIGFFSMIAIEADNVTLDLNGHTLQQSEEHALQQRFFSIIETAEAPFIAGQGPHNFVDGEGPIEAADNLVIKNGTIGLSSHHGIHGNGNQNVRVENIDFVDYEVGAVALNGVNGLEVYNSSAINRVDVPILGTFSNAKFIQPYIDYLADYVRRTPNADLKLELPTGDLSIFDIQTALRTSINNVFEDVILDGLGTIDKAEHPEEWYLFHNPKGVVDGNSYGYLVGAIGVQVNGFPVASELTDPSTDVNLKNVHVHRQHSFVSEIPTLGVDPDGGTSYAPVIDPVGAAFMLLNNPNGKANTLLDDGDGNSLDDPYKGNVLANAQLIVAKAAEAGYFDKSSLDISRLSIGTDVVEWAESGEPLSALRPSYEEGWIYNTDTMVHVQKGTIPFKIDGVEGAELTDVSATNVKSFGLPGSTLGGDYEKGFDKQTLTGYNGTAVRGFTFAGSKDVVVKHSSVHDLTSDYGPVYGYQVLTDSKEIEIYDSTVGDLDAGAAIADGEAPGAPNHPAVEVPYFIGENASASIHDNLDKKASNSLLFSISRNDNINGLSIKNEDIVHFDGSDFSIFFDGSDVGLRTRALSAFDVISHNEILISINKAKNLPGIGKVRPQDVVKFTATSLGEHTAGHFSMYFDGSDVGLFGAREKIDAISGSRNGGELLLSTVGNLSAKGRYRANKEDISRFKPRQFGDRTRGQFSKYFDGSDVGLGNNNIDALSLDSQHELVFSTRSTLNSGSLSTEPEDVFEFKPTSLGSHIRETFALDVLFDGSQFDLGGNNLLGVDLTF